MYRNPASSISRRLLRPAIAAALVGMLGLATGCETTGFIDPSNQLYDPKKENQLNADGTATPKVQVILNDLDLNMDAPAIDFPSARAVQRSDQDVQAVEDVIGPGDVLRVVTQDYPTVGIPNFEVHQVTNTGNIVLPDGIGEVAVQGMTIGEAARELERQLEESGLMQPGAAKVTVLIVQSFNRRFFVTGAVNAPGPQELTKPDLRLMEALALAGATVEPRFAAEYIYIIRDTTVGQRTPRNTNQPRNTNTPRNGGNVAPGGNDPLNPQSKLPAENLPDASEIPSGMVEEPIVASLMAQNQSGGSQNFNFEEPADDNSREVIQVPMQELLRGEFKYNIPIRQGDTIIVKSPPTGTYYIGGHANLTGVYEIQPGNRVTLMQAITAARGLDQVAIPSRTQLVRRVGDTNAFVRVDLKRIFNGEDPDIVLKADDHIMIGTNLPASFLAAIRNGFRVSYGAGVIYDRNFARDRDDPFAF